jgi:hypothetical protein
MLLIGFKLAAIVASFLAGAKFGRSAEAKIVASLINAEQDAKAIVNTLHIRYREVIAKL